MKEVEHMYVSVFKISTKFRSKPLGTRTYRPFHPCYCCSLCLA